MLSQQSSATRGEKAFLDARAALSSKVPLLITDQLWKLGREECWSLVGQSSYLSTKLDE